MAFRVVNLDEVEESVQPVVRKTNPYMTRFEFTRACVERVIQLQAGEPCSFERTPSMRISDIAEAEVRARTAPLIIRRTLPDGTYEDWKLSELEMEEAYVSPITPGIMSNTKPRKVEMLASLWAQDIVFFPSK